jgi:hypothetical protein
MTRFIALVVTLSLIAGCGSGGGTDVASGGIGGTGISSGPVGGIGSFFVTGTRWSVAPAGTVVIDGQPMTENDLRLGMVLTVEGERSQGGAIGEASRVVFDDDVEGPVDTLIPIDGDAGTSADDEIFFTIFGQGVLADRATIFANTDFDDFRLSAAGWVVEVSGLADLDSTFGDVVRATRVELRALAPISGATPIELEGPIQNLGGASFEIRSVSIRINDPACGATTIDDPIQDGDRVDVEGLFLSGMPNEAVCARVVDRDEPLPDGDGFEIEAIVTSIVNATRFVLGGITVDASGASFEPMGLQVAIGMRLEVEGELQGGTLIARQVEQRGSVRIEAVVTSVATDSFVVLDQVIQTDAATEFNPGLPAVTDFVEVRAVENGLGGFTAIRVDVEPNVDADRVRLRGRVEELDVPGGSLTILGIQIPTKPATECRLADGALVACATFFATVEIGDVVQATDDIGPFESFDVADELEIED